MKWLNVKRHSRSAHTRIVRRARRVGGRAFSLVEVMIGIFILGIGVIAISALFPAGIAQQQFSNDDIIGSIVANNAMTVIRGKVSAEDFGDFGLNAVPRVRVQGDWPWIRPSIILSDDPNTFADERGAVDLFGFSLDSGGNFLTGAVLAYASESYDGGNNFVAIPYNPDRYGSVPLIGIMQAERYYPQQTELVAAGQRQQPQYVWDCMFRRYEGRIYVAIFVYRVADPESQVNGPYRVVAAGDNPDITPVPYRLSFDAGGFGSGGNFATWAADQNPVTGISPLNSYTPLDPATQEHAWQEPRQWIVDQNTNIHRVLSNYPSDTGNALSVELVRPVPGMPNVFPNWFETSSGSPVSDIWFIPLVDTAGRSLTPVYATVQEL